MEKDSKIFIIALLIIFIIVFVSLNFNDITGKAVEQTSPILVTVSSNEDSVNEFIRAGSPMYINVKTTKARFHRTIKIYDSDDHYLTRVDIRHCSIYCHEDDSVSYRSSTDWEPGIYYARIFDYTNKEFVKGYFTIV